MNVFLSMIYQAVGTCLCCLFTGISTLLSLSSFLFLIIPNTLSWVSDRLKLLILAPRTLGTISDPPFGSLLLETIWYYKESINSWTPAETLFWAFEARLLLVTCTCCLVFLLFLCSEKNHKFLFLTVDCSSWPKVPWWC